MTPPRTSLLAALLAVGAFSLALRLEPASASHRTDRTGGFLQALLGDGRRLFANHFFAKADAYFHRGVYPTIFDAPHEKDMHLVSEGSSTSADAHDHDEHHDEHHAGDHADEAVAEPHTNRPAPTLDWIARFNRHFSPSAHDHLGGNETREMLPWLRLAAELDPSNVQNFTITAYWLRTRMKQVEQAERFLREGLRENPNSPEIFLDLAVIALENHQDPARAANLLELALTHWNRQEAEAKEPNPVLGQAILVRLARIEEAAGHYQRALELLQVLRPLSPQPEAIDRLMDDVRAKMSPPQPAPDAP